jgi:hypothetical protein
MPNLVRGFRARSVLRTCFASPRCENKSRRHGRRGHRGRYLDKRGEEREQKGRSKSKAKGSGGTKHELQIPRHFTAILLFSFRLNYRITTQTTNPDDIF